MDGLTVHEGGFRIRHAPRVLTLLESDGRRLHALLLRLTLRHDVAEDLLQDLVIKLAASSGFAAAGNPYAFARTAAVNLALDWRRRTVTRRKREQAQPQPPPATPQPLVALEQAELLDRLLDEVDQLRDCDRELIVMRFLDAMDYEQIGLAIGKTTQQARGLCFHAVRRLRDRLHGVMDEEGDAASAGIGQQP